MRASLAVRVAFIRRVYRYFRPDAWRLVLLLGALVAASFVGLAQVWPLALLVDVVLLSSERPPLWDHPLLQSWLRSVPAQILALAVAGLLLRILHEGLLMLRSLLHVKLTQQGILRVRRDLFRKLQALSLDFHFAQPQGDTIYRLMMDAPGCEKILSVSVEIAVALSTLAAMLSLMFSRSALLSCIALGVVPLLLIINRLFGDHLKRESRDARSAESQLTSVAQRNMSSMVLVQAFRREAWEYLRFDDAAGSSAAAWFRTQRQMALYRLCVGGVFGVGAALIFGMGGHLVSQGEMSVGDLMIFLTYLGMFFDPLCKISGAGTNMTQGIIGMQRVFDVLDRHAMVGDAPQATELACQPRTLELRDVSFSYRGDTCVLDRLSAVIYPGQSVAFVGSSGVGKSTLMNLVPRFYDPTCGSIHLDGVDLREVKLSDVRRHVALVLQESPLLPTTIRENIAYGRPDATDEQIRQAAELAGAAEFIEQFPQGYETVISEAGKNLSGGQRQRIGIARALLTEAPIVVLDEPTSALDPAHEEQFLATLRSLQGKRTIITVSHRWSTIEHCDQIFVMERGRITERGTHLQLLNMRGYYWRMRRPSEQLGNRIGRDRAVEAA